jgi:hypothetical protein
LPAGIGHSLCCRNVPTLGWVPKKVSKFASSAVSVNQKVFWYTNEYPFVLDRSVMWRARRVSSISTRARERGMGWPSILGGYRSLEKVDLVRNAGKDDASKRWIKCEAFSLHVVLG